MVIRKTGKIQGRRLKHRNRDTISIKNIRRRVDDQVTDIVIGIANSDKRADYPGIRIEGMIGSNSKYKQR